MRIVKAILGLLALGFGLTICIPIFLMVGGSGPVFGWVLGAAFAVVVCWFFLGRKRGEAGPASESSFLHQTSKDGLL